MLLHRKNDSREASSMSEMRYGVSGATPSGSRSTRNRKYGLTRMRCSASSMPASKPPVSRPDQRIQVGFRNGPAEGPPRQAGDDLPRAAQLPILRFPRLRAAGEYAPPAGRVARARRVVRTADLDAADARETELGVVVVPRLRLHGFLGRPLDHARLFREGDADHVAPGGDRRAELHLVVRVRQVVRQRRVVGLQSLVPLLDLLAAHVERLDPPAVEQRIDAVRMQQAADLVDPVARHANPEHVLPVHRKVVRNGDAAARAERQLLVRASLLHQRPRDAIHDRPQSRIADRQPADLARRRHVALQEQRRDGQHVGDVVESAA